MFSRKIFGIQGGPKFWKKNTWKFFFGNTSYGCLSPPFGVAPPPYRGAYLGGEGYIAYLPTKCRF